jgi:predicted RNA-binding Zn-ribbon protein involved in translation (DUF1610 family)
MKQIGLQPSDTGEPGGKEAGQSVTHYIVAGAAPSPKPMPSSRGAALSCTGNRPPAKAKQASKTKFTCPDCGQNAWGKPDTALICGLCYDDGEGEICVMLAETSQEAHAA